MFGGDMTGARNGGGSGGSGAPGSQGPSWGGGGGGGGNGADSPEAMIRKGGDPTAMGLSPEQLAARKEEASKPYKVTKGDKEFSVTSTARAQQILQKGIVGKMHDKRTAEVKRKAGIVNALRWSILGIGVVGMGVMIYEVMLPISKLHWDRQERMRRRHEEIFKPALMKLIDEKRERGEDVEGILGNEPGKSL